MISNYGYLYGVCGWVGWKQSIRTLAKAVFIGSYPQHFMSKVKVKPNKKVIKVVCFQCGELIAKFYPWSSINEINNKPLEKAEIPCRKCLAKKRNTRFI